jgi:hypothetical protein
MPNIYLVREVVEGVLIVEVPPDERIVLPPDERIVLLEERTVELLDGRLVVRDTDGVVLRETVFEERTVEVLDERVVVRDTDGVVVRVTVLDGRTVDLFVVLVAPTCVADPCWGRFTTVVDWGRVTEGDLVTEDGTFVRVVLVVVRTLELP